MCASRILPDTTHLYDPFCGSITFRRARHQPQLELERQLGAVGFRAAVRAGVDIERPADAVAGDVLQHRIGDEAVAAGAPAVFGREREARLVPLQAGAAVDL